MSIRLGVVMDPIDRIIYKKDSTLAMLWAAASRGWELFYMEQADLFLENGTAMGNMASLSVKKDPENYYQLGGKEARKLCELNVILMRKDPPFDNNYIYTTYILEAAELAGALIVNKPQSLRDCNEKVFATQFPQCCPPVLVSADKNRLRQFHQQHQDVIFKPLDGMGGTAIFRLKAGDPNVSVIIETLTNHGRLPIMAQRFIPEISEGDKRILVVDGKPIDYCLARIPAVGETRGNLAAGGSGEVRKLSERDRWICEQVVPTLMEKGLMFVGLDVIGDYLTEINVTSPTCIREIEQVTQIPIGDMLMEAIEKKLAQRA